MSLRMSLSYWVVVLVVVASRIGTTCAFVIPGSSIFTMSLVSMVTGPISRIPSRAPSLVQIDMAGSMSANNDDDDDDGSDKQIILLRHGCTYMNEYLGRVVPFGAPSFTDIFTDPYERELYHDSVLSPRGIQQVKRLATELLQTGVHHPLSQCDLIVVSPLRRALQTMHMGIIEPCQQLQRREQHSKSDISSLSRCVVAHPDAAERLYLISDVGTPVPELVKQFDYVDFQTAFSTIQSSADEANQDVVGQDQHLFGRWWYHPSQFGGTYREWRPSEQGQQYACPSEPADIFARRLERLCIWLNGRPERSIAVVCHWGVIDAMLDQDFDNCQWKQVRVDDLLPLRKLRQPQQITQKRSPAYD